MVRQWDVQTGSAHDSALAGRSPLTATAMRALIMEDASLRGRVTVLVLWDVEKFFDSIDILQLLRQAERMDFPTEVLLLGMQAHRAPRSLRVLGTQAHLMETLGRSIIAGCTLSTSWARAYLRPAVAGLDADEGHLVTEHVDDMDQLTVQDDEDTAASVAVRQGLHLAKGITALNLTISGKSTVISNTPKVAARVARRLGHQGFPVRPGQVGEDLGVATRGGRVRTTRSFQARTAKARRRAKARRHT